MKRIDVLFFLILSSCILLLCVPLFGAEMVMDDAFSSYRHDWKIAEAGLKHLNSIGYEDENALLRMDIPKQWKVSWTTFPKNCTFGKNEKGFSIHSPDGVFQIFAQGFFIRNCKGIVTIDVSNVSQEKTAEISSGWKDLNTLLEHGTKTLKKVVVEPNTRKQLTYEVSGLDGFEQSAIFIDVQGDVILHRFKMEAIPIPGVTCVEGTVVERSKLPDPKKTDYQNCRYTIRFKGNAILAGEKCNRTIALTLEGFRNKKTLKTNILKVGDQIECIIAPFENLPEKEQETQVADDLNMFDLDNYYVYAIRKLGEFSSSPTPFADVGGDYISIFERHINPPLPEEVVNAQKAQIARDLEKLTELLKDYPEQAIQWDRDYVKALKAEVAKDAPGRNRLVHNDEEYLWREVDHSFWTLPVTHRIVAKYVSLNQQHLDALLGLKKFLEANGVQLIVSVGPFWHDIAARVIVDGYRDFPDFRTGLLIKTLLENGIEAVYGSDAILANFNRHPFAFLFPVDWHPGDTVQDVLAELVARRLERYHFKETMDKDKFSISQGEHVYYAGLEKDYYFPENCDIGDHDPGSPYFCQYIEYDGKDVAPDRNSELVIFGNSFTRAPRGIPESYPAYLAWHSLVNPDWYVVQGDGPMVTMMERLFQRPEKYLKGKKVLNLYIAATHFHSKIMWNNVEQMDANQLLLNGKQLMDEIIPAGESVESKVEINLPGKHEYVCTGDTAKIIASIDCDGLDASRPVSCLIPACAEYRTKIQLHCNDVTIDVPHYIERGPVWYNLMAELPAGTKKITVSISGQEDAVFAVQKILILQ